MPVSGAQQSMMNLRNPQYHRHPAALAVILATGQTLASGRDYGETLRILRREGGGGKSSNHNPPRSEATTPTLPCFCAAALFESASFVSPLFPGD